MAHPASPPPSPAVPGPVRRTVRAETLARLRAAAVTEPGRLRIIGAVLTLLVLAFGTVTVCQTAGRAAAADAVVDRGRPLSTDAASIYRSLADADTTAAGAFLTGDGGSPALRERYERDIRTASRLLTEAAANTGAPGHGRAEITELNEQLTVYTGLVETARANDRQGLPLGGAYLRHASERMREHMLPAADALHRSETARLGGDRHRARAWPVPALLTGVAALAALGWAQRRHHLRTNRVFSPGLLAATAATATLLVWLAAGHWLARSALDESDRHGARSLQVLNAAWTTALQARGDENLTLVARGGGTAYEKSYRAGMRTLAGSRSSGGAGPDRQNGGQLARALELADDEAGRAPVERAVRAAAAWRERHAAARELENGGRYEAAVGLVIRPGEDTARSAFDEVDTALAEAVRHEQREFGRAAERGRDALAGLPAGAGALSVLAVAGVAAGIGRRLSEYR
ncbi:hypothetical protein [Streptomyces carminius]|uniref:hypothetical protein n=1 Tax=Streptomyces carminius TaxID=2665496 RepID=UPI001E551399|nr:hypothetical protein [Streptomyces carminius]